MRSAARFWALLARSSACFANAGFTGSGSLFGTNRSPARRKSGFAVDAMQESWSAGAVSPRSDPSGGRADSHDCFPAGDLRCPRFVQHEEGDAMENVLAVNFGDDAEAYKALTQLEELGEQGQVELVGAAVVVRGEDGGVDTKAEVGDADYEGTATGGIVGLVIGILGGPLGVLVGGATGLLIGSLFDVEDTDETESALSDISRAVRPGSTALIAQLAEQSFEVVDAAMAGLGGSVIRRPLEEVQAEIASAEDAQQAAATAARKRLREQRREQTKEKVQAKIQELKAKLGKLKAKLHHRDPVGAGSN